MNLLFFDRTAAPHVPGGQPVLTVRRDGNFLLAAAAVARYDLDAQQWVRLAQDTTCGAWFLVFGAGPSEARPFELRVSKGKGAQARCFSTAATAKLVCAAFGLASEAKTLRLQVGAPLAHTAGQLYPLQMEGAVAPVLLPDTAEAPVPAKPVTIASDSRTIAPDSAATSPAEETCAGPVLAPVLAPALAAVPAAGKLRNWSEADNQYLDGHYATTPMAELCAYLGRTAAAISYRASTRGLSKNSPTDVAAPVVVATPANVPEQAEPPRKTFGLQARAEELTTYWKEREMSLTTPNELGEVLNLLRHVARDKRSFGMDVVLDRAEKEHTERLKGAGKGRTAA